MFRPTLAVAADFTKIIYPVYASPKLDGIRCSVVNGKALTRSLKAIPNRYISEFLSNDDFNGLDGELIIGSPCSTTVYRDTNSGVMSFEGEPNFTYFVFDVHNVDVPYTLRHKSLQTKMLDLPDCIQELDQTICHNEAEVLAYEEMCVNLGYEGIILRSPIAPYKFGRSTVKEGYLLKVKRFDDSEAEIIGFEEEMFNGNEAQTNELGRTKRSTAQDGLTGKSTLGAFTVRDLVSCIEFSIGTGLTAADRQHFWNNQQSLVGQTLKYKYFAVGVKTKPRHPVFLGLRAHQDL